MVTTVGVTKSQKRVKKDVNNYLFFHEKRHGTYRISSSQKKTRYLPSWYLIQTLCANITSNVYDTQFGVRFPTQLLYRFSLISRFSLSLIQPLIDSWLVHLLLCRRDSCPGVVRNFKILSQVDPVDYTIAGSCFLLSIPTHVRFFNTLTFRRLTYIVTMSCS